MKTESLRPIKAGAIAWLCAISLLVSCSETEESVESGPFNGRWELSNFVQVNNEDGIPRQSHDLVSLNHSLLLGHQGIYLGENEGSNIVKGKWSTKHDHLFLNLEDGTNLMLEIHKFEDGKLVLIQSYPAEGKLASGIIHYSFNKN